MERSADHRSTCLRTPTVIRGLRTIRTSMSHTDLRIRVTRCLRTSRIYGSRSMSTDNFGRMRKSIYGSQQNDLRIMSRTDISEVCGSRSTTRRMSTDIHVRPPSQMSTDILASIPEVCGSLSLSLISLCLTDLRITVHDDSRHHLQQIIKQTPAAHMI